MEIRKNNKYALVLGATGLVGTQLVNILLKSPHYQKVRTLSRKELKPRTERHEPLQINFEKMDEFRSVFKVHDVYCCLGTTMAKAGSKEAFKKVDHDYVLNAATLAKDQGAAQFLLVSAVGADKNSMFFYSQIKGKIEESILELNFWATHIFRPSLLLGDREESRPAEYLAQVIGGGIAPVLGNLLGSYRPVTGEQVAEAMHLAAQSMEGGIHYYSSNRIYSEPIKRIE